MYNHQKTKDRQLILKQVGLFAVDAKLAVSLLANLSALLKQYYPEANWCGFYLAKEEVLYLGPFQGESACQLIPFGKGVCGTAAATKTSQIVQDVRLLENHIVCDATSVSEIVIPMISEDKIYGVLDIDAPQVGYFDEEDREFLESLIAEIMPSLLKLE